MTRMYRHFSEIAGAYNDIRTTDVAPVRYVARCLEGKPAVRAADVGCGSGRYDRLFFEHIPGLHVTCIDVNDAMLERAAEYLHRHDQHDFATVRAEVSDLRLPERSLDCVFSFNAVHHFDPVVFLRRVAPALKEGGWVFVYTRLRSQNARTIWGRLFPGFVAKESRLYDLAQVEDWLGQIDELMLDVIRFFRFRRVATREELLQKAERHHYSTFSLYSPREFREAVHRFGENLEREFGQVERIAWFDENVMLAFRRMRAAGR